jgi:cell division protein FtsB
MEGRTRIRWDRLGRWALIGVFALVLYLYVGPAISWVKTYREAARQRSDVAALRAENAKLRARRDALNQADAMELEARKQGMVKAGERAYIVSGIPGLR